MDKLSRCNVWTSRWFHQTWMDFDKELSCRSQSVWSSLRFRLPGDDSLVLSLRIYFLCWINFWGYLNLFFGVIYLCCSFLKYWKIFFNLKHFLDITCNIPHPLLCAHQMHIISLSLINLQNCRRQFSLIRKSSGEMKIHSWKLIPSLIALRPHQTDFVAVFTLILHKIVIKCDHKSCRSRQAFSFFVLARYQDFYRDWVHIKPAFVFSELKWYFVVFIALFLTCR